MTSPVTGTDGSASRSWASPGFALATASSRPRPPGHPSRARPPLRPPPGVWPAATATGPTPPANGRKRILIIAQTMGWHHDSISDSLAVLVKLGLDANLYDAEIRTDSEWITKKRVNPMRKNLVQYDAIVFCSTTGELPLSEEQKADLMSFVKDEGKGFVGIHAALDTFYNWPIRRDDRGYSTGPLNPSRPASSGVRLRP